MGSHSASSKESSGESDELDYYYIVFESLYRTIVTLACNINDFTSISYQNTNNCMVDSCRNKQPVENQNVAQKNFQNIWL